MVALELYQRASRCRLTPVPHRHWKEFENPARTDGLRLAHWERVRSMELGDPGGTDPYHFARFNTTTNVYSYTSDEYIAHLRDETGDWSKQETDYLFKLCHDYDLRWFVMHDRWDYATEDNEEQTAAAAEQGPAGSTQVVQDSQRELPAQDGAAGTAVEATTVGESVSEKPAAVVGKDDMAVDEAANVQRAIDSGEQGKPDGNDSNLQDSQPTAAAPAAEAAQVPPRAVSPKVSQTAGPKQRSIEDMKDRYYSVCRRLIRSRPAGDENAKASLLQSYMFEKGAVLSTVHTLISTERGHRPRSRKKATYLGGPAKTFAQTAQRGGISIH